MAGLFEENGPFYLTPGGVLAKRQYSWHKLFNMIYIDNPVGVGT
jgi:vitellogenic carboxypeptidase-like protein